MPRTIEAAILFDSRADSMTNFFTLKIAKRKMVEERFKGVECIFPIGAGGGTRTRTTFYSPRILSPVRLPFRHTGYLLFTTFPAVLSLTRLTCASICASVVA